jgi:hypothetical protein
MALDAAKFFQILPIGNAIRGAAAGRVMATSTFPGPPFFEACLKRTFTEGGAR